MDEEYILEFASTPPENMRFRLHETEEGDGMLIRIKFPEAASYEVWDMDDNKITENEWDENLGAPARITKTAGELITGYPNCGEWRFAGGESNDMDIYITPGCRMQVRKRDAVLSNVRMNWTLEEFYADGGTSSFADRVSAALGVHRSQVKVVAVYYGSVNVQYVINALPEPEYYEESDITAGLTTEEIGNIDLNALVHEFEATLVEVFESEDMAEVFGAEVLAADVGGGVELVAEEVTEVAGFIGGA